MNNTYQFHLLNNTQLYQPGTNSPKDYNSHQWHEAIDKLIANRYSFVSETYSAEGYIFRGISSGLKSALEHNSFAHFESNNELAMVEQIMNVYFYTHELSDALTVARLFDDSGPDDAGVIILPATQFVHAFMKHEAAMLAIGDIGFVFRYPFLCSPISIADIVYILFKENKLDLTDYSHSIIDKLIPISANGRKQSEEEILDLLKTRHIKPATIEKTENYPRITK